MSPSLDPPTLKARKAALRLTNRELATLSDMDETNLGSILDGRRGCLYETLKKIDAALLAEEERLWKHLESLPSREAAA